MPNSTWQLVKRIYQKAIPLMVIPGADIASNIVTVYLIANAHQEAIDATTIIYRISDFVILPIPYLFYQVAVYQSELYGKLNQNSLEQNENTDHEDATDIELRIGELVRVGFVISLFSGLIIAPIFYMLSDKFLIHNFEQDRTINRLSSQYLIPFCFSIPLNFIAIANERFLSTINKESWLIPYKALLFAIQLISSLFLINGLETKGAGLATLIKNAFAVIFGILFFLCHKDLQKFKIFNFSFTEKECLKNSLKQGLPMLLMQLTSVIISYITSTYVSKLGKNLLGLEQAISQVTSFPLIITIGITNAANRIMAQENGAHNNYLVKSYAKIGLINNLVTYSFIIFAFNFFAVELCKQFMEKETLDSSFENLIRYNFAILSIANIFNVMFNIIQSNLAVFKDTLFSFISSLCSSLLITLTLSTIFLYRTDFGFYGITMPIACSAIINATINFKYWTNYSNSLSSSDNGNSQRGTSNTRVANCCKQLFWCDSIKYESQLEENHNINETTSLIGRRSATLTN